MAPCRGSCGLRPGPHAGDSVDACRGSWCACALRTAARGLNRGSVKSCDSRSVELRQCEFCLFRRDCGTLRQARADCQLRDRRGRQPIDHARTKDQVVYKHPLLRASMVLVPLNGFEEGSGSGCFLGLCRNCQARGDPETLSLLHPKVIPYATTN